MDLSSPAVMGVLNVTPDSFSDGGSYYSGGRLDLSLALERALTMQREGATIIDVGGESTRPSAELVSVQEELDRTVPVIEKIRSETDVWLSIDTSQPEVMREAASAGVDMINDVRALTAHGAIETAANTGLAVCLMHIQGDPQTMQQKPQYRDVVDEVRKYLRQRAKSAIQAGISEERLLIDPGFGFGKTLDHNLVLLRNLEQLETLDLPVLVGISRKRMVGDVTGKPTEQRLAGSLAMAMVALQRGASILRVHDVAETMDVLKVYSALGN